LTVKCNDNVKHIMVRNGGVAASAELRGFCPSVTMHDT